MKYSYSTAFLVLFFLTLFFSGNTTAYSQVNQSWSAIYNSLTGTSDDKAEDIISDAAGNVYVTGYIDTIANITGRNYATIKYNSAGTQLWLAKYNGPGNGQDEANAIALDDSGNVYVTGRSMSASNNLDITTIKYSSTGVQKWAASYNGPNNNIDYGVSVAVDDSGNVYVAGSSSSGNQGYNYVTIKYGPTGTQKWAAIYTSGGNSPDYIKDLTIDNAGNVYVTGYIILNGNNHNCVTIKYNTMGVQQWIANYNGPGGGIDAGNSVKVDNTGNVYVVGFCQGAASGSDYLTLKYSPAGAQLWAAIYNGPGNLVDQAYSLMIDAAGVYITGRSAGTGTSDDIATIKYNTSGVQQWVSRYNGPGNGIDVATNSNGLALDKYGNVYVTGESIGVGTFYDVVTLKYNAMGVQQWVVRYDNPAASDSSDNGRAIFVDTLNNVYVTGFTGNGGLSNNYVTLKYIQPVGITNIDLKTPLKHTLYQNYPNPFNPETKIRFQIANSQNVKMIIYDITGSEAAILIDGKLNAGTYEVKWDGSQFSSGAYLYSLLINGVKIDTKRLVLIK